jgi:hypothetical protein
MTVTDFRSGCDCETCAADHRKNNCRRVGQWYVEFHQVDVCKTSPREGIVLCQPCFDEHVNLAIATIDWGTSGVRSPLCQGCFTPLVNLSAIIENVERL